jgi:hypothetical protein
MQKFRHRFHVNLCQHFLSKCIFDEKCFRHKKNVPTEIFDQKNPCRIARRLLETIYMKVKIGVVPNV